MRKTSEIPKYIDVLGSRYRVRVTSDKLIDPETREELAGLTHNDSKLIEIAGYQDTSKRWKTFLHEYMHAALHVGGPVFLLEDNGEEVIVRNIESAMIQLIEQVGPQLVKYIKNEHAEDEDKE